MRINLRGSLGLGGLKTYYLEGSMATEKPNIVYPKGDIRRPLIIAAILQKQGGLSYSELSRLTGFNRKVITTYIEQLKIIGANFRVIDSVSLTDAGPLINANNLSILLEPFDL